MENTVRKKSIEILRAERDAAERSDAPDETKRIWRDYIDARIEHEQSGEKVK